MDHIYHSFEELPTPDETGEVIGYTTGGQPEADGAEPNFNDDDGGCRALYQKFTDEKHPRNRWDMALWACSYNDWKSGYGSRYSGPYADRTSEMYALHDAFIEEYIEARNRSGWKKEDGSEIEYPLVDVLDAYEAWRRKESAKPKAERVCEFGSNGFPLSLGQFTAFVEAVELGTDCYFDDRLDDMHIYYDRLALRGLVPDERHVRDLPPDVAEDMGLCVMLAGIENDEELLPPNIVQYLMARQRANGFTRLHEEDEEETVSWMREESEKLDDTKMFVALEQILFPSYREIRREDRLAPRKIVGTDGAEKETYRAGFPVPYADFTPEHHPTSPLHIAFWLAHHYLHDYSRGDYPAYSGPYARRLGEIRKMHYAFVREYLSKMEASGWKNQDGSRITDALKHIIDSFEDWRKRETAKPPEERACEFGEDGFPASAGAFEPFLELANDFVTYLMDGGTQEYRHCIDLYAQLAFRGLVWDACNLRELPFWELKKYTFHRRLKGVENDEELFPPKYAKRLMVLREFEEEVERKKARIPSAGDGKDGQPGVATPDEGKEGK